ncbi:MAG: hypothetical protein Q8O12_00570 [Candidatus Omnitrophota bacterium]|nr:hypothetical protein [Candidatus Omnitrophota bacterium]
MMLFVWTVILGFLQSAATLNINFLFLLAIFAGLKKGPVWGVSVGMLAGVIAGIMPSSSPWLTLMLYSGSGLASGIIKHKVYYREGFLAEFIFSFFGMLTFYLAYFSLTKTFQPGVLFTVIFSALISPVFFRIMEQ